MTFQGAIALFADDTAILSTAYNCHLLYYQLQNHIDILENWLTLWRIKVNEQKTHAVYFTYQHSLPDRLEIGTTRLRWERRCKYLGMDWRLTWYPHIDDVLIKFNRAKNVISNVLFSNHLNMYNKSLLVKLYLLPII